MNIVVKRLDELSRPDKNIRIHTPKQIDEYVRSLEMFGQIRPIVIDEVGRIIAGNGMYDALIKMGRETCECYIAVGLSEAKKKKLMLADNKVFELGITDTEAFEEILKDLGTDFDIPGYDTSMLEMLSMSFADVDSYIGNYGSFDTNDVERISEKSAETYTEGTTSASPGNFKPTPISNYILEETHVSEHLNGQENTKIERHIICPKCGERICL